MTNSVQIERPLMLHHPVLRMPSEGQVAAMVAEHGVTYLADFMRQRNAAIRAELEDPLGHGFDLPTWLLADVLLGFISYDVFRMKLEKMIPLCGYQGVDVSLREWLADKKLRAAIEAGPYNMGCLLGGNSAGKTDYIIRRMGEHGLKFAESEIWAFHQSETMSIDYHQARMWKYLPVQWKEAGMRGKPAYVAYKSATGFPKGKVIGPNGSKFMFKNYGQDEDDAVEGGEVGDPLFRRCLGWVGDELMPESLLRTLEKRLNRRQAVGVLGFTPKWGYSETVARFLDGASLVRAERGTELKREKWIPLVRVNRDMVIINFHTRYNPYPNLKAYPALIQRVQIDNDDERAIRLYGHTEKERRVLFPRLSAGVHVFDN